MSFRYRYKEWRKERREIKGLKQLIKEQQRLHAPKIDAAENDGIREVLIGNYMDDVDVYEVELLHINTKKLTKIARAKGINYPKDNDDWYWMRHTYDGRTVKVLSSYGEVQLRNRIRKHQRKNIDYYLRIIGALTGLIGATIGLVAILK